MSGIRDFFIKKNPNKQIILTQGHIDNIYTLLIIMGTAVMMLLFLVYHLYSIGGLV